MIAGAPAIDDAVRGGHWSALMSAVSSTLRPALIAPLALFSDDLRGIGATPISWKGVGYLVICGAAWAVYTIVSKPLLRSYDSFTVTAVTMLIAAPPLIAAANEPLWDLARKLDGRQWAEVFYLVVPNGLLGTLLWNYGAKHLSGAATGMFLYLIPVVAVICGALMLGEAVTIPIVAGGLLMLAGVAVAQFGPDIMRRR